MAKRKFGFEGFGIARQQPTFTFEPAPAASRRLPIPIPIPSAPRPPHDHYEDHDVDNIEYDDDELHRPHQESEPTLDRNSSHHLEPEEEIDPLDAFMEGIHEEVKKAPVQAKSKMDNLEDEEDDPVESFLKARRDAGLSLAAEALHAGYDSDEEVYAVAKAVDAGLVEYDSDDNPVITLDRRKIEPLPPLDHSDIDYGSFSKDFYDEKTSISGMSEEEVASYRNSLAIKVSGFDVPRPVKEFDNLAFNALLASAISKQGYERPTPIQCQALPVALSGRDMIGIAKTGSGKTAAFVLPMIVHILDQEELDKGEGPIGVICAPTRELAQQIYTETKKFAKPHGIRVSGIFGGMSKFDQFKELKAGCEVVIATPGRLIDMLKMKALTMLRATYLVLDEADRMFDLGFEPQIRSIVGQIRPDRQTLLFSATMPKRVERLAREILSDPVRIAVGEVGSANEDITQIVTVIPSDDEKLPWLYNRLPEMVDEGDVLVFVSTKLKVEDVENRLTEKGFKVAALHGDKDQASRMEVLQKFKSGIYHVLVATDVASRGLDIKSIKSVVNFDIAKDMDSHVHRIGRTGRAGDKDGVAYTLITHKEARFAGELVNSLIAAGQTVPVELMDLAMKDSRFRARREERKGGKKGGARGRTKGNSTGSGGGRMVRGVDFGMGIGYKRETDNKAFQVTGKTEIPNRGAAVDALKTGMMARFKSSFVAASVGNVQGSATNVPTANQQSSSPYQRRTLGGVGYGNGKGPSLSAFVSGGSIGGVSHNQASGGMVGFSSAATAPTADHSPYALQSGRSLDVAGDLKAGRQDAEHDREISRWGRGNSHHVKPGDSKEQSHASGQERSRERRRPSGWDR